MCGMRSQGGERVGLDGEGETIIHSMNEHSTFTLIDHVKISCCLDTHARLPLSASSRHGLRGLCLRDAVESGTNFGQVQRVVSAENKPICVSSGLQFGHSLYGQLQTLWTERDAYVYDPRFDNLTHTIVSELLLGSSVVFP
jgi:hypothetical protein